MGRRGRVEETSWPSAATEWTTTSAAAFAATWAAWTTAKSATTARTFAWRAEPKGFAQPRVE